MRTLYQSLQAKMNTNVVDVKLFCGLLYRDMNILHEATNQMVRAFGPIDHESDIFPFDHTEYYKSEMGDGLIRKFISFEEMVPPNKLSAVKCKTIDIEKKLSDQVEEDYNRTINIDPGYLELGKLILASTKNYSHRIYLDKGIYAEITLQYENKKFKFLRWTYPDYYDPTALAFFEQVRNIYKQQIRK